LNAPGGTTHGVVARRTVSRDIADREVVTKLFDTIAPRFADRNGGYTRLLRLGYRRGDAAEVAQVELIGSEFNPNADADSAKTAEADKPKKKTVGGRIREALGGGRKKDADSKGAKPARADVKGAGKKVTTPRKAGGS